MNIASNSLWRLILSIFRGSKDDELEDEFRFHIDMLISENIATGMTPNESRDQAQRQFGDVNRIKLLCRETHRGDRARPFRWLLYLILGWGIVIWVSSPVSQVKVLGEMLVITVCLVRLLTRVRHRARSNGCSHSDINDWRIFCPTAQSDEAQQYGSASGKSFLQRMQQRGSMMIESSLVVVALALCVLTAIAAVTAFSLTVGR